MRRLLLVVALIGVVVLAGCAGAGINTDSSDGSEPSVDAPDEPEPESEPEAEPETEAESEPEPESEIEPESTDREDTLTDVDGELEIHHIDVGQADAALIRTPDGETIVIDTGDWRQDGSGVIEYLEAHDVDRIDHLIGTHGHADHIGGHAAIIEHYETERDGIGAVYDSGVPHTSQTYERYLDAVEEYDVELFVVEEGDELPIDDANVSGLVVNPPAGDSGSDLHFNSVSIVFEFGDVRYLTTGDAETDAESRMIEAWADELDADIYQAGHHGSTTSSTPPFLDTVAPEVAIISSNFDSQYGHPHDEILEAFAEREIETYWTGVHGDIVLTTDGSTIAIETETEFSNDADELLEAKQEDTPPSIGPAFRLPRVTG